MPLLLQDPDKNTAHQTALTPWLSEAGAAALEYILVSTFAAVVAVAALGFVSKVVKDQLTVMAAKLGVSETPDIPNPLTPGR